MKWLITILLLLASLSAFSQVKVRGYYRKDGTYVRPHYRSSPDGNPYNNWSYPGNRNPYTGKVASGNSDTYLKNYNNHKKTDNTVKVSGYFRKNGTYVKSHHRSSPDGNPFNNWSYPGNTNPYTGKVATGNPDTYLKNYYKYVANNKSNLASYLYSRGLESFNEKNYQDAFIYGVDAIYNHKALGGKKQESARYYVFSAKCAVFMNDKSLVNKMLNPKYISYAMKDEELVNQIGNIYCLLENYNKAIEFHKKALKIDKHNKEAYQDIVYIYEKKLNTYRKAVKYRQRFKKYYPNQYIYNGIISTTN